MILDLCRDLPREGFPCEIAILYRRMPGEQAEHPMVAAARAQGTPITQLDGHLSAFPAAIRWARRKLQGGDYPILHAHEYKSDLLAALAAGKKRSTTLVATVRHTEPGFQMALFQAFDSLVLHRFDRLSLPSEAALWELRRWPVLRRRTRVIQHHRLGSYAAATGSRKDGGPVISIVARLQAVKGHRLFLDSARLVLRKRPDSRFWIVGEGPMRAELEAAASRLGVANSVSFLGYRDDAISLMASSDIVVSASSYESFGRSLVEAQAVGRPVVATAVGGTPEIIRDGRSGILVPYGDAEAMATAVLRLLEDKQLARRMGAAGREYLAESGIKETPASAFASLYREALACR